MIFYGLPPINANATNTVAVWPGQIFSAAAYREDIASARGKLPLLMTVSAIGAVIGAVILLKTPQATFMRLIPWLLLGATLLFTFSKTITARLQGVSGGDRHNTPAALLVQFVISVYTGYFGAGAGIMMLAMLAVLGETNIHVMNGIKTVLNAIANGVAVAAFILARAVYWREGILMLIGASLGGYFGAYYARKSSPELVRRMVIAIGFIMTIYFFIRKA